MLCLNEASKVLFSYNFYTCILLASAHGSLSGSTWGSTRKTGPPFPAHSCILWPGKSHGVISESFLDQEKIVSAQV